MELLKYLLIAVLLIYYAANSSASPSVKGQARKFSLRQVPHNSRYFMRSAGNEGSGVEGFPEEMKYAFSMDDGAEIMLHLIRDNHFNLPQILKKHQTGVVRDIRQPGRQRIAFYTDSNGYGSFACYLRQGVCELSALLTVGQETCFIGGGSTKADCTEDHHYSTTRPKNAASSAMASANSMSGTHKRSSLPSKKSLQVTFAADKQLMERFYNRHPSNQNAAEAEAAVYFGLVTSQMNAYFASITEASYGAMEIHVDTTLLYPFHGQDMEFSGASENVLYRDAELDGKLEGLVEESDADHVFAITGLLVKDRVAGVNMDSFSYPGTVCSNSRQKYSLVASNTYDLAYIASRALGYALGADYENGTSCGGESSVMSESYCTSETLCRNRKFSCCSVQQMSSYLNSQIECLTSDAFSNSQFNTLFCGGFVDELYFSLDRQCQEQVGWKGSRACSGMTPGACSGTNTILCEDKSGNCSVALSNVWTGTPCNTGRVCYQNNCDFTCDICPVSSTPATTVTVTTLSSTTASTTSSSTSSSTSSTTSSSTASTTSSTTSSSTSSSTSSTTSSSTSSSTSSTTSSSTSSSTSSTTSSSTSSSTSSTTSTTSSTTSTSTSSSSTTTTSAVPCSCCDRPSERKRVKCCNNNFSIYNTDCYCCGDLLNVTPPPTWTGN